MPDTYVKKRRIFYLIFLFLLIFCNNKLLGAEKSNGQLVIEPGSQFAFAESYFKEGRYFQAIAEFERFIHFFPDDPRVPGARYRIGLALFNSGRFKEAIESFSTIIQRHYPSKLSMKSYFRMSECFVKLKDPGSAIKLLENLAETAPSSVIRDEARYRAGWIYLDMGNFQAAMDTFQKISQANRERFRLQKLTDELSKERLFPQKDPFTAGALSIVPGAGFLYCERYQDALVAFFVNGAFFWAAYESFDQGNEGLAGLITFVGTGFYLGNIYGAISSAHKYNRESKKRFLQELHSRTRVTLSSTGDLNGLFLGVKYNF